LLLLNGLNITTAVNASFILNAESLFTVLIAYVFLNERCVKKKNTSEFSCCLRE
jgi:drug/metabolite transporter (DMT)-like permease